MTKKNTKKGFEILVCLLGALNIKKFHENLKIKTKL
jgi:hypothetical protein